MTCELAAPSCRGRGIALLDVSCRVAFQFRQSHQFLVCTVLRCIPDELLGVRVSSAVDYRRRLPRSRPAPVRSASPAANGSCAPCLSCPQYPLFCVSPVLYLQMRDYQKRGRSRCTRWSGRRNCYVSDNLHSRRAQRMTFFVQSHQQGSRRNALLEQRYHRTC